MIEIIDFHTHHLEADSALISVDPRQFDPRPGRYYSVGFHPWNDVQSLSDGDFEMLEQCAAHPQVLAIGETGLDALRGGELTAQSMVYARHLQLAARLNKPVVVHTVRTAQQILAIRRREGLDGVSLAIHGMRGNANVARLFLDAGCYLSYGLHFNPSALQCTPLDRVLIETDDADITINDVAAQVASILGRSVSEILTLTAANAARLLRL